MYIVGLLGKTCRDSCQVLLYEMAHSRPPEGGEGVRRAAAPPSKVLDGVGGGGGAPSAPPTLVRSVLGYNVVHGTCILYYIFSSLTLFCPFMIMKCPSPYFCPTPTSNVPAALGTLPQLTWHLETVE